VLSVQRSTIGVPFFVAIAAGLIVTLMMFTIGDVSGGYFNPALTLAMWTARKVTALAGVAYIVAQLLGGWAAYGLYKYFSNTKLQPVGGHYATRILIAEAVGTAIFAFGYTAAVYKRYTPAVTAAFAGLAFMLGIVAASSASLGLLNPAVALGARAWVWGTYVLGPVLGAIIGVNLYDLLFAAEGESANLLAYSAVRTVPVITSKPLVKTTITKKRTTTTRKR
jgi:glycerol uptake facilitator-like aquaporin